MASGGSAQPFRRGTRFFSDLATYELSDPIGSGSYGYTWQAKVIACSSTQKNDVSGRDTVVIKIPQVDIDREAGENTSRLGKITTSLALEAQTLTRLRGLDCVAHVLDLGSHKIRISRERGARGLFEAPFLVYEYIEGASLRKHLRSVYAPSGTFRGVGLADDFFRLARDLASVVREVHRRGVVHGDIWPDNIMVRPDGRLVLIDFGQAILRDLIIRSGRGASAYHAYLAPERRTEVQAEVPADVYSVGATLFYIATGDDPPKTLSPDLAKQKNKIINLLRSANSELYDSNCGIADIIARCLRRVEHDRVQTAEGVLQDVDLFQPTLASKPKGRKAKPRLAGAGESLVHIKNPMLQVMAEMRIRKLEGALADMAHGIYDLTGDHEDLTAGLAQYLSLLGLTNGDQYLTITIPAFWAASNLGIRGRYLSINRLVAERGATVRRLFIMTKREERDESVQQILGAHRDVADSLRTKGINVDNRDVSAGGYWVGKHLITAAALKKVRREHSHYGLLTKDGHATWVFPVYRQDGSLVSLQFRSVDTRAESLRRRFSDFLELATPL